MSAARLTGVLNVMPFVNVYDMMQLARTLETETVLRDLAACIEKDFHR